MSTTYRDPGRNDFTIVERITRGGWTRFLVLNSEGKRIHVFPALTAAEAWIEAERKILREQSALRSCVVTSTTHDQSPNS